MRRFVPFLLSTCLIFSQQPVLAASGRMSTAANDAAKAEKEAARALAKANREAAAAAKKAEALRAKGPYEPDVQLFVGSKAPELRPYYRALFVEGERNAVLNFDRIGLLELQNHNLTAAKWAFDNALHRIESIYAKDPAAKAAKSLWVEEKVKDFKGEPYERAMTYYYRGLIYLMEGDFQNARASFISGEYQDTISEREEFEGDFAVLDYLAGWASHCDGNESLAKEYFGYAKEGNPDLKEPVPDGKVLMIFEAGNGPQKQNSGKYGEYLAFQSGDRGPSARTRFTYSGDGARVEVLGQEASSVSFQAMTRGGKPFQTVLDGKAQFKEVSGAVGTVATQAGVGIAAVGLQNNDANAAYAGAAVALFGLLAQAASNASKPAADTRYWDMLPDAVDIGVSPISPTGPGVTAQLLSASSDPVGDGKPLFTAGTDQCRIAWGRQFDGQGAASAPNSAYSGKPNTAMLQKDARFRSSLLAEADPAN